MSATGYLLNNYTDSYKPKLSEKVEQILNDFKSAFTYHSGLDEYAPTPIINLPELAKKSGVNKLLIKDEGQRFGIGAIKILGASYALNQISSDENILGICTATDGNHGRAIAWASKRKGYKSVIFVPRNTSKSRIQFIQDEGAKVIVSNGTYDDAVQEAAYFAKEKHFKLIQDTSWEDYTDTPAYVTAGYYTQLVEIAQETQNFTNPKIDCIFLQAGVGSWPSAVVHFIRHHLKNTSIKIVCVEPYESDCIYESIKSTSLANTKKSQKTIMAGLNCGTPSVIALEILKQGVDAFLLISDQYTIDAIKYLNAPLPKDPYIAAGESGAAGLAGFIAVMNTPTLSGLKAKLDINEQSNILLFNTEAVTNPELTSSLLL